MTAPRTPPDPPSGGPPGGPPLPPPAPPPYPAQPPGYPVPGPVGYGYPARPPAYPAPGVATGTGAPSRGLRPGAIVAIVVSAVLVASLAAVAVVLLLRRDGGAGEVAVTSSTTRAATTTTRAKLSDADVPAVLRSIIGDTATSGTYYLSPDEADCFARIAAERLTAEEAAALTGGRPTVDIVGKIGPAFDQCVGTATLARMYSDIITQLFRNSGITVTDEQAPCLGTELAVTLRFSELAMREVPGAVDVASIQDRMQQAAVACGVV